MNGYYESKLIYADVPFELQPGEKFKCQRYSIDLTKEECLIERTMRRENGDNRCNKCQVGMVLAGETNGESNANF